MPQAFGATALLRLEARRRERGASRRSHEEGFHEDDALGGPGPISRSRCSTGRDGESAALPREVVPDDGTVVLENGVSTPGLTLKVASNDFSLDGGDACPAVPIPGSACPTSRPWPTG